MRTLKRNKREIYLCKAYDDNGITKFKEPKLVKLNYNSTASQVVALNFADYYSENLQAVVDIEIGKLFTQGDRCYIYKKPPKEYDILCKDADYIVNTIPEASLNSVKINFKRLVREV